MRDVRRGLLVLGAVVALLAGALCGDALAALEPPAPYWVECVKAATKDGGEYTSKKCFGSKAGKNNYSLKEGVGGGQPFHGKFAAAHSEVLILSDPLAERQGNEPHGTVGAADLGCKKASVTGVDALPNLVTGVQIALSKCVFGMKWLSQFKWSGGQACSSPGAAAGELKLSALRGEAGYTDVEEETGPPFAGHLQVRPGFRFESESDPGGVILEFTCGSEVEGRVFNQWIADVGGGETQVFTKELAFLPASRTADFEDELAGHKYAPQVNAPGWWDEISEIELGERPPHVLEVELCGSYVEHQLGVTCTPRMAAALKMGFAVKGETLMLQNPDATLCTDNGCNPNR